MIWGMTVHISLDLFMDIPLKLNISSLQFVFGMRIINLFCFPGFVACKYSVKEFYKHAEGNPGLMGIFSLLPSFLPPFFPSLGVSSM